MKIFRKLLQVSFVPMLVAVTISVIGQAAYADTEPTHINWTDWQNATTYAAVGIIETPTAGVVVNYYNSQGMAFVQLGAEGAPGEIDYWQNFRNGRNPATSPYTSEGVANIPTNTDLIALRYAGSQTLDFSVPVANLVFSYVSLNGNGYGFDQDFEILSFGDGVLNDCAYWGCGTSYKEIVTLEDGTVEYQLLSDVPGEPHGTIRFLGAFDSISWRSLSDEYWNGFTVGIQGTTAEVLCASPAGGPDKFQSEYEVGDEQVKIDYESSAKYQIEVKNADSGNVLYKCDRDGDKLQFEQKDDGGNVTYKYDGPFLD